MKKLLVIGHAGAGKNTVSDYLVTKYGFRSYALAAKIKGIARDLFDYTEEQKARFRSTLQKIGTSMREISLEEFGDRDVWLHYLANQIRMNSLFKDENVIIEDVRYKNEVQFFLDRGYTPWFVECSMHNLQKRITKRDGKFNPGTYNHPSETEVDELKGMFTTLDNNWDKEYLYKQIDNLMLEAK